MQITGNKTYKRKVFYHNPMTFGEAKESYDLIVHEIERIKTNFSSSYRNKIHKNDEKFIRLCLEDLCALSHQKSVQDEYNKCLIEEKQASKTTILKNPLRRQINPLRRQIMKSYFNIQKVLSEYCAGKEAKS